MIYMLKYMISSKTKLRLSTLIVVSDKKKKKQGYIFHFREVKK